MEQTIWKIGGEGETRRVKSTAMLESQLYKKERIKKCHTVEKILEDQIKRGVRGSCSADANADAVTKQYLSTFNGQKGEETGKGHDINRKLGEMVGVAKLATRLTYISQ